MVSSWGPNECEATKVKGDVNDATLVASRDLEMIHWVLGRHLMANRQ